MCCTLWAYGCTFRLRCFAAEQIARRTCLGTELEQIDTRPKDDREVSPAGRHGRSLRRDIVQGVHLQAIFSDESIPGE